MELDSAARRVIDECLRLRRGERLAVFFDHSGRSIAEALVEGSGIDNGRQVITRFVPTEHQLQLAIDKRLPSQLRVDIAAADVCVFALTDSNRTTGFRVNALALAVPNAARILHMPGVDAAVFTRAVEGLDFKKLHRRARKIARRLERSTEFTVETRSCEGELHRLELQRGDRRVHVCGGLAMPGEIMNFPTGEVYFAPIEETATGTIVLNGATESAVFRRRDEIILCFRKGRLDFGRSRFPRTEKNARFENELTSVFAQSPDNLLLCELGVGLNDKITKLTGNEVWDEKADGTIHIALGANKPFGGTIATNYHRDITIYPERILSKGREIKLPWRQAYIDQSSE